MPPLFQDELEGFHQRLVNGLNDHVFAEIYSRLQSCPGLRNTLNPAFPFPTEIKVGVLRNCLAIEYRGPYLPNQENVTSEIEQDLQKDIFQWLGIEVAHLNTAFGVPVAANPMDTAFFLGDAVVRLTDYLYDFTQMPVGMHVLNGFVDLRLADRPLVASNVTYFWTDPGGDLKIKHIDFLEIIPYVNDELVWHTTENLQRLAQGILGTEVPTYDVAVHGALNEFIQLIQLPETTEPTITRFLEQNLHVLRLAMGAQRIESQVDLIWQYEAGKPNLKPDFMLQRTDGFFDICDFKLPRLSGNPSVGSSVRLHPSATVDSAIAQVTEYANWCSQEVNRRWLKETKDVEVRNPVKHLVMGHSRDFSADFRRELRDTRDTVILTYDEIIQMARYQLYCAH